MCETSKISLKRAQGDYCLALTAYYEAKEYFASEKLLEEIMAADGQYRKETEITTYNYKRIFHHK